MIKHFGIYTNSGDVQTALNEETIINPYVALVSGALDYNGVVPGPNTGVGLTIITSDGSVITGHTEDGIFYDAGYFEKPYDSTFTVYYNGVVATAETGLVAYKRCGSEGDGYIIDDGIDVNNITLEDLDYGTQFGEEGDMVTVGFTYLAPTETGCGEDEPYDEPCPSDVWIYITNDNCYGCENWEDWPGPEDMCGCAGGTWDGEGSYCECNGDPECECKLNGGYWDGTKCWYSPFPEHEEEFNDPGE